MQKDLTEKKIQSVGAMRKRRVLMADGKRYLIYYTFAGGDEDQAVAEDSKLPEAQTQNSAVEEEKINV